MCIRDRPETTPEQSASPIVSYDDERWDAILDACLETDMIDLINNGVVSGSRSRSVVVTCAPNIGHS